MKFRRRPAPLLLLLVPLASALSAALQDNTESTLTKTAQARDTRIDSTDSPAVDLNTKPKYEIGTKDAPVDGKDGKPHAGPWVGTEKDPKKAKAKDEDTELVEGKDKSSKMLNVDGTEIPTVNDGVMDDPHRQLPKEGTTGTEGGVSEKDKARKAHEGQTGEKLEKKPDSPKEAPPLPDSEQEKIKAEKSRTKVKEVPVEDEDDGEGLGGLEVCSICNPNCEFH